MWGFFRRRRDLLAICQTVEAENMRLRGELDSLQLALDLQRKLVAALREVNADLDRRRSMERRA